MNAVFFGVFWLQAVTPVLGFPTGAPASVCESMKPQHSGVQPQPNQPPYIIETSNSTFQSGQPLTVIIKGPDYAGVLLEARSGSSTNALGSWGSPPAHTKHLGCSGNSHGAITHSNTNMKNNLTVYTWMPPETSDSIYFMATVAKGQTVYWLNVKSATLTRDGVVDTGSAADPKMASAPVLLLLTLLASTLFHC
ncbi:putative defense protein 3 [Pygocentrus nattereri]|uniref:Reelin domain-containing protein n=1 Tax=Pygocentrus nattereri TaxID=42514 RepID=A0A3B4DHD3_PYGNA|nr:putative defense protein 3 [Pygocentrus nattereri]